MHFLLYSLLPNSSLSATSSVKLELSKRMICLDEQQPQSDGLHFREVRDSLQLIHTGTFTPESLISEG